MIRIVVLGATAAGKSQIALHLAKKLGAPIVAVDSRTVYKDFDIGTAKPSAEDVATVPHFNLSLLSADKIDSPKAFEERLKTFPIASQDAVVFCGGSTLYLQQLLFGSDSVPVRSEINTGHLEALIENRGKPALLHWLKLVDPEYALRVDGFNRVRILRALDVWLQTGQPFSSFHTLELALPENTLVIGINRSGAALKHRIEQRVDEMIASGLENELDRLLERYGRDDLPAFRTVGYKEFIDGRKTGKSVELVREEIVRNTVQYAKRQITWFKRWPFIDWYDAENEPVERIVASIVSKMGNFRRI